MEIAFIGTRGVPASYSGFETCVEQLGRRMVERGHRVTVFCRTSHYPPGRRPTEYLGMRLIYLPALPEKHFETLTHTLLSALRLPRRAAVVCMGVGNAPVVRLLEAAGRRTVFNVDGADWRRDKWGRFASWYLRFCERVASTGSSVVVADARAVQRYYQELYGRPSELVAYGADPPCDSGSDVLEHFGVEPGRYVLWVGRLVPENGAHHFLAGMAEAQPGLPAVVVGDAPYADEYKADLRRAAPADAVFTGYQFGPAYQQFSSHAWAYVLAAGVGGTHPVLVEQMAAGNAILARDTESNREVLGDAGLYWSTPEELAQLLSGLKADEPERCALRAAARRRATDLYNWDQVTDRYLELCAGTLS